MKRLTLSVLVMPLCLLALAGQKAQGDTSATSRPSDYIPTIKAGTEEDVKKQIEKAGKGNLSSAQSLFAHFCMYTDDQKACDYWTVRSAELGDERLRCTVIDRYKEYKAFAAYEPIIKKLLRKGKCKAKS